MSINQVSEADRLKAVERVRNAMAPIFGGTPGFKRRRGIYRALRRQDPEVLARYQYELNMLWMMGRMEMALYWETSTADGDNDV